MFINSLKDSNVDIEISIFSGASIWINNNICLWVIFMFMLMEFLSVTLETTCNPLDFLNYV